jgi:hypothetical protein
VTILNAAIGASNGTVSFHEAEDSTMGSLAIDGYKGQRGRVIQVNCRRLDSIIEELDIKPDLVKIDVEGFEDLVLSGATKMFRLFRPRLMLEVNPGALHERLTQILSEYGYEFYNITDRGLTRCREIVPVAAFSL